MSIKKQFLKSKPMCKVTLSVPKSISNGAKKIQVVGDFNNWNTKKATPMEQLKNGIFKATLSLETGKTYQFKYLIDGEIWENDDYADDYVRNDFDTMNSIVNLQ